MKNVLLYFGSFNPVHKGHIALAEYALDNDLCDEVVLVVSPLNPLKQQTELAPEMDRFEMAEIACTASRYPERIKASVVEFLLDKPSYTIDTLRYLEKNNGADMCFSVLMGADNIVQFDRWKEYNEILDRYIIYVYPRNGVVVDKFRDRITYLEKAPLWDFSSTEIRMAAWIGQPLDIYVGNAVADYIARKELWTPASRIAALTARIEQGDAPIEIYIERGRIHYRHNDWGKALNDFRTVLRIAPSHQEAREYVNMAEEILAFRYKDIYNP